MRVLALDLGEVRTGIATSDVRGSIALPVCVLPTNEVLSCSRRFQMILEDNDPELLLVGKPLSLSGKSAQQAERIEGLAHGIAASCGLPLEFVDERLSSAEAKRILKSRGYTEHRMRGKIDMIAASLFLETWLKRQAKES